MNCHGPVKINEDVKFFLWGEFAFWSFDFLPEAHCSLPGGESGLKIISKRRMLSGGCRNVLC